jgi:hypothetical protein
MRPADTQTNAAIRQHLANGNMPKAIASNAIDALWLATTMRAIVEELESLHSAAKVLACPNNAAAPTQVKPGNLCSVLQKLPKDKAGGSLGWTHEHIKATADHSMATLESTLSLVNAVAAGCLPHAPAYLDSRLIAVQMPSGGIRPIAVAEALVRLAGLCAKAARLHASTSALPPLQLGVGVFRGRRARSAERY